MRTRRLSAALLAVLTGALLIGAASQIAKMVTPESTSVSAMNKAELVGA
ncbi:hypothetical protein GCM10010387_57440 [Streptomyces inusitatus]|uniref:Uncharacterized protein n=1 Tax=Streptomyces inusitatus TaxID=68221 RepID=A0A918QMK1_9ACTN|nr:hypothetical protein [Streptomyces inusitatus]GGZ55832.1 hypothetical protein GCM10010387_57440 [Streptomyces inusitatus]